jgi:hypothetical protein
MFHPAALSNQDRSPRRNLVDFERDVVLEDRERLPHAGAGNAAANREKLFDERHPGFTGGVRERCSLVKGVLFCPSLKFPFP